MKISEFIKGLRYRSSIGFLTALVFYKIYIVFKYRLHSDVYYISRDFELVLGYKLDLKNPKTLSEKLQWYKIHYKNPLIQLCADKYAVRQYVTQVIGEKYLVPLVFHTQDYQEIRPNNLPDYPIVIKANHTSGTTHFVNDKSKADWRTIQTDCRWWLHLNYYYIDKEWQYENI